MGELIKVITNKTIGRLRANGSDKCAKCGFVLCAGIKAVLKRGSRKQRWFHLDCFQLMHY